MERLERIERLDVVSFGKHTPMCAEFSCYTQFRMESTVRGSLTRLFRQVQMLPQPVSG